MVTHVPAFQGEFRFLSNFWPAKVMLDGVEYPTTEHAYQAAKVTNLLNRKLILSCRSAGEAKRMGRNFRIRPDWEEAKLKVMFDLQVQKYKDPTLQALLIAIDGDITEGNTWGDRFWGVSGGEGENHLGKILMRVRDGYLLLAMCGVYPGDPDGTMTKQGCELLGLPYEPITIEVTVSNDCA